MSSLGKGIATASIGLVLKEMGYTLKLKKLDPYLNIDPGTMNPMQHGEVFVTEDGTETDLDLGHYERFTGVDTDRNSNTTAGSIYKTLLEKERRGDYLGKTVQTIPHVTDLIKNFIRKGEKETDIIITEIGGTVGDIEALPFLEAIRQVKYDVGAENVMYIHITLVPFIAVSKELKTKPTQHSVKELMSLGIVPDMLLCRTAVELCEDDKKKIATFCNVPYENVIEGQDMSSIYSVPLDYLRQGVHKVITDRLHLPLNEVRLDGLKTLLNTPKSTDIIKIGLAGKYVSHKDAYKSICEAVNHASIHLGKTCEIVSIDTKLLDNATTEQISEICKSLDKIIIPGGFGQDGLEGKVKIIKHARENNIPLLGICLGMQLMAIEFARNVLGIQNASTEELAQTGTLNIINMMEEQKKLMNLGGTMRLGAYKAVLSDKSKACKFYNSGEISERHRHRYELDIKYRKQFEEAGMIFSGLSPDGFLPEIIELAKADFFIGVQFHPELKSQLFNPHPLFVNLVRV